MNINQGQGQEVQIAAHQQEEEAHNPSMLYSKNGRAQRELGERILQDISK